MVKNNIYGEKHKIIPDEIIESKEIPRHFDVAIVLGNNMGKLRRPKMDFSTGDVLSMDSEIVAIGAGLLYEQNPDIKLLISSGNTTGKKGWNSEAQSIRNQMRILFPNIPDSAFILEEESFDTTSNAKLTKQTLLKKEFLDKSLCLLTMKNHTHRAARAFEENGLRMSPIAAEEILSASRRELAKFVSAYENSPMTKTENLREAFIRDILSPILKKLNIEPEKVSGLLRKPRS